MTVVIVSYHRLRADGVSLIKTVFGIFSGAPGRKFASGVFLLEVSLALVGVASPA